MTNDILGATGGRIYLVKYVDQSVDWKSGSYYVVGSDKIQKNEYGIDIIGYSIKKEITSFREAQEEIASLSAQPESVLIPWVNIVYVKNISYTLKK